MAGETTVPETVEPSSQTVETQETVVADAEENLDALKTRLKDFEDRLTKEGRSKAQIKAETDSLKGKLDTALKELSDAKGKLAQWNETYYTRWAPDTDKVAYQRQMAAKVQQDQMTAGQREKMWQAIAEEENPKVRTALREAGAEGEVLGPAAIKAIRNTLASVEPTIETEEKAPTKISATRQTTSTGKPTLEQQLADVMGDKTMRRDEKARELVAIKSQIAARDMNTKRAQ